MRQRAPSIVSVFSMGLLLAAHVQGQQFARLDKDGALKTSRAMFLAAGDLDGDGDIDLLLGRRILFNVDRAQFLSDVSFADGDQASVVLGDIDADGDLDIVFGGGIRDPQQLWLNEGARRFRDATATHLPGARAHTPAMALADFDADGDLDLLCARSGFIGINADDQLYLNDGAGRFTLGTGRLVADGEYTWGLAVGDLDRDGDLDYVTANLSQTGALYARINLNDGTGRFRLSGGGLGGCVASLALADVDRDGDPDIIVGRGINGTGAQTRLFLNDGRANFTDATAGRMPSDCAYTTAVVATDVNGDGHVDLVLAAFGGQDRLFRNDGAGFFSDVTAATMPPDRELTMACVAVDCDGDAAPDIVRGGFRQPNSVYLNDGRGHFATLAPSRLPFELDFGGQPAIGDVDGDGEVDIVVPVDESGQALQGRLLRQAAGQFMDATAGRLKADGIQTRAAALGDVDADGDLDLVLAQLRTPSKLYRNDGRGVFAYDSGAMPPEGGETAVAFEDLDGDGDRDLLFAGPLGHRRLLRNDGGGRFSDVTAGRLPDLQIKQMALVDFDGDGDLDLFAVEPPRLLLNDGQATFTEVTSSHLPGFAATSRIQGMLPGDFDGDGDTDVLLIVTDCPTAFQCWQANVVYENRGNGSFLRSPTLTFPQIGAWLLVGADFDADQRLDVIAWTINEVLLLRRGSTGGFSIVERYAMRYIRALTVADLDGDGDQDVLVTRGDEEDVILSGLHRQLHAPHIARLGHPYPIVLYAEPGYARGQIFAITWLGWRRANPPIAVPVWGVFWIDPTAALQLPVLAFPANGGQVTHDLVIPAVPALRGVTILAQAAILHSPAAQDWRLSNLSEDLVR